MSHTRDYENPFRPELKGALSLMEASIDLALSGVRDEDARSAIPAEITEWTAFELWSDGKMGSLAEFEACLRQIGSKLYCLAVPASAYGEGHTVLNPADGTERHFMMVLACGEDEAALLRQEWEMSPEENMNRLAVAGLRHQSLRFS